MAGARVFVFMCVRGLHRGVLLRGHAPFLRCGQPLPEPHAFSWAQMRGGGGGTRIKPRQGKGESGRQARPWTATTATTPAMPASRSTPRCTCIMLASGWRTEAALCPLRPCGTRCSLGHARPCASMHTCRCHTCVHAPARACMQARIPVLPGAPAQPLVLVVVAHQPVWRRRHRRRAAATGRSIPRQPRPAAAAAGHGAARRVQLLPVAAGGTRALHQRLPPAVAAHGQHDQRAMAGPWRVAAGAPPRAPPPSPRFAPINPLASLRSA